MNTAILNSFLTVVQYKSFTQASQVLNVTQPTISNHIASLEELYGTPLFQRVGKTVILTAAGRAFVSVAERLLAAHEESIKEMAVFKETEPVLRIGLTAQSITYKMAGVLRTLNEEFPGMCIRIETHYTMENLTKAIKDKDVDFGFIHIDNQPLYMKRLRLWEENIYFVASPKLYEKHNQSNNIYEYPVVAYTDRNLSSKINNLDVDFSKLNIVAESNDTMTVLHSIADGIGIGIVPAKKLEFYKKYTDLVVLPAPYDTGKVVYSVIYDSELDLNPIRKRFVELLEENREIE